MAPTDRRPWGPRAPHLLNEVHERLPATGHRGVPAEHDVRPGDFRGVYVGGRSRDLHVTWRRYKRIEDGDRRPARPQGPAHWGPGRRGRSPSQRRPSCASVLGTGRPAWASSPARRRCGGALVPNTGPLTAKHLRTPAAPAGRGGQGHLGERAPHANAALGARGARVPGRLSTAEQTATVTCRLHRTRPNSALGVRGQHLGAL